MIHEHRLLSISELSPEMKNALYTIHQQVYKADRGLTPMSADEWKEKLAKPYFGWKKIALVGGFFPPLAPAAVSSYALLTEKAYVKGHPWQKVLEAGAAATEMQETSWQFLRLLSFLSQYVKTEETHLLVESRENEDIQFFSRLSSLLRRRGWMDMHDTTEAQQVLSLFIPMAGVKLLESPAGIRCQRTNYAGALISSNLLVLKSYC